MRTHTHKQCGHLHTFGLDQKQEGERRTFLVFAITIIMMVIEIAAGMHFGSIALLADGLVQPHDNPAHQRSVLIRATAEGERRFREAEARERALLQEAAQRFRLDDLDRTATTLRTLTDLLGDSAAGGDT